MVPFKRFQNLNYMNYSNICYKIYGKQYTLYDRLNTTFRGSYFFLHLFAPFSLFTYMVAKFSENVNKKEAKSDIISAKFYCSAFSLFSFLSKVLDVYIIHDNLAMKPPGKRAGEAKLVGGFRILSFILTPAVSIADKHRRCFLPQAGAGRIYIYL